MSNQIPVGMKPGRRELNGASLQVQMCNEVHEHMRAKLREITHVHVPLADRRQRIGTMLMNLVCQEADANNVTLLLTAMPQDADSPGPEKLIEWYGRFGFSALQESTHGLVMARRVHIKQRPLVEPVRLAPSIRLALHPTVN